MKVTLAAALLLTAAPAFAQRYASRPYDEWERAPLEGVYAAIGGGGQLLIAPGDNALGFDGEVRLGYSFNPRLALYLSGSVDGASFSGGTSVRAETVAVFLQYHLYARPQLMVYARGGIGVGLSSDVTEDGSTAAGLAGAGGIGMEIRVSPGLYLAPELFYKNMNLDGGGVSTDLQMIGLQLSLVYY